MTDLHLNYARKFGLLHGAVRFHIMQMKWCIDRLKSHKGRDGFDETIAIMDELVGRLQRVLDKVSDKDEVRP